MSHISLIRFTWTKWHQFTDVVWGKLTKETGSVLWQHRSVHSTLFQDNVERKSQTFQRSLPKSVYRRSSQWGLPCSNIHDVMHKILKLLAYKCQLFQMIIH